MIRKPGASVYRYVALASLLVLFVAGCGDGNDSNGKGQGGGAPTATTTFAPSATAPLATATQIPTSATLTPTRTAPAAATSTATAPLPATSTFTPAPPSATLTSQPPTSTATATATAADTATAAPTHTAGATATPTELGGFRVQSSIEQLLISDAPPGVELAVRNAAGQMLQSGTVDRQGTLIFRDLTPGEGYVVFRADGSVGPESPPLAVWSMDQTPPNAFYAAQHVGTGYQYITTRDGTQLAINVFMPGPPEEGPYPTVVEYSGYDPANPDAPQPSTLIATALGYAAVGINMRGTGCSGGSFKFFEPAQDTDGYDAVEIIAQQPWVKFNKVGMVGLSYPGISQLFVAQLQPPHLASIAPLSIISDTARGILYPGGILNNGFATDWAAERQHDAEPYGQEWAAKRRDQGDQACIANQRFRGQNPDLLDIIRENDFYRPEIADRLGPVNFVDKINVPVFLAGAWQDEQTGGYFPTMLDHFTGTDKLHFTMTNGGHTDSLGPSIFSRWNEFLSFYVRHEIPVLPGIAKLALTVIGQQVFGVDRLTVEKDRFVNEPDFETALAKFEAEPKVRILFENGGVSNKPGAPVPRFEHSFDQWPVAGLQPTAWYFGDNGRLTSETPTGNGADSYLYDTALSQLTTIEGGDDVIWKALPNWNWRQAGAGKAVSYESDVLPETLVMLGSGSVDLWLQSTATDTDLQVTLSEVRPDSKETYVQTGYLRASHRASDPQQSTPLRPFHTMFESDAAPLPAGQFSLARVEIFPFAHVFRAGSRLRISIDTPGGTRPRWKFDVLEPGAPVVNTIAHSAAAPSRIVLPVLPGITAPSDLPPCPSLRLQYCRPYQARTNTAAH